MNYNHHAVYLRLAITQGSITAHRLANELKAAHEAGKRDAQRWLPIADAPLEPEKPYHERTLWLVYAPAYEGLSAITTVCRYHNDAGWCVDELRSVTLYQPLPPPPEPKS